MGESQTAGTVVLVRDVASDGGLVQTLLACNAAVHVATLDNVFVRIDECSLDAVVVELGDDESTLARRPRGSASCDRASDRDRHAAVDRTGRRRTPRLPVVRGRHEATLRVALDGAPRVNADRLLDELLTLSVFGVDLAEALRELTVRVARAFDADDCILLLSQEATAYTARGLNFVGAEFPRRWSPRRVGCANWQLTRWTTAEARSCFPRPFILWRGGAVAR